MHRLIMCRVEIVRSPWLKNICVSERKKLQFRAEGFNICSHPSLYQYQHSSFLAELPTDKWNWTGDSPVIGLAGVYRKHRQRYFGFRFVIGSVGSHRAEELKMATVKLKDNVFSEFLLACLTDTPGMR